MVYSSSRRQPQKWGQPQNEDDLKNKDDPKNEDNLKITLIFFDDLLPYGHTTTDVRPKIIPEMEFHMTNIL